MLAALMHMQNLTVETKKTEILSPTFFEQMEKNLLAVLRSFYALRAMDEQLETLPKQPELPDTQPKTVAKPLNNDIRNCFSLNDKFLFLRELFNGNTTKMNLVIDNLNAKSSPNECREYMESLGWSFENQTVTELWTCVERRFEK